MPTATLEPRVGAPDHLTPGGEESAVATVPAPRLPSRRETLAVLMVALAGYLVLGIEVTVDRHVVVFADLDRLAQAFGALYGDPPDLTTLGSTLPPLASVALLPFALLKPLATSLVALPLFSAVCAALTLGVLGRLLGRVGMGPAPRLIVLLALAVNPLFAFHASSGSAEALALLLLAVALHGFVSWYLTTESRHLATAGLGFSLAVLAWYGFIAWAALTLVLIGVALGRKQRGADEAQGAMVAFAAPAIYAAALWLLSNWLIAGDPVAPVNAAGPTAAVNAAAGPGVGAGGPGAHAVSHGLLHLVEAAAPMALVVLPLLLVAFLVRRDDMALWLASLLAVGLLLLGGAVLVGGDLHRLALRQGLPILLTAVIGAAWLYGGAGSRRRPAGAAMVLLLVVSVPITWRAMDRYPYQDQEQAFRRALTTGTDQEGTHSRGGVEVGVGSERSMAAHIDAVVHGRQRILTDSAQSFGVILLSGRPGLFFTQATAGQARFAAVTQTPWGRVDYLLLTRGTGGDAALRRILRDLPPGPQPDPRTGFVPVYTTARYVLVSVPTRAPTAPITWTGAPPLAPMPATGG